MTAGKGRKGERKDSLKGNVDEDSSRGIAIENLYVTLPMPPSNESSPEKRLVVHFSIFIPVWLVGGRLCFPQFCWFMNAGPPFYLVFIAILFPRPCHSFQATTQVLYSFPATTQACHEVFFYSFPPATTPAQRKVRDPPRNLHHPCQSPVLHQVVITARDKADI